MLGYTLYPIHAASCLFCTPRRLGVDDFDSYEQLCRFVAVVAEGSMVTHFIVHARKCFLKGLNPHQNRTVPPLRHEWAYALRCVRTIKGQFALEWNRGKAGDVWAAGAGSANMLPQGPQPALDPQPTLDPQLALDPQPALDPQLALEQNRATT